MRFVHGTVSMEVPDEWVDQSQLAFAEPIDKSIALDFARAAAQAGAPRNLQAPAEHKPRANFVLSTKSFFVEGVDPRAFAAQELQTMLGQIQAGDRSELSYAPLGGHEAAVMEVEFGYEELNLRQLHGLVIIGDRILHFCGTATPGSFDSLRPEFLRIMASIDLGNP